MQSSESRHTSGPAIVLYLAAGTLLFHLLTAGRYGIFRDELYYLACSEHLAWGYVDQPPLIALIAWFARHVFGNSLLGLRLLPAFAGGTLVWLTGKLAREMGGGRFAQALAAMAVAGVPIYLLMDHWLTMNAFEPLIWMGCAWCILRVINSNDPGYWLLFGILVGLGTETKYSIAFFVAGVTAGLIVTPQRRALVNKWFWLGALAALLVFLPNLLWLARHDFPFLELMHNIRMSTRDVVRGPIPFIADQVLLLNPLLFPLWAGGLAWLLLDRHGRRYSVLGWTFAVVLTLFIVLKGKDYYVAPVYPMLFAAGAVGFEALTRLHARWTRVAYTALAAVAILALAPLATPVLSPETFLRYQKAIGIVPPKSENQDNGPLPQYFADEFGWENMARQVAQVYNSLSPDERSRTAVFANGYGEAAAIDFFGPRYGLPKAISVHQNYWYWGPRSYTGSTVIVLGSDGSGDREHFGSVEVAGRVEHIYSRRDEHFDIFLCRKPTFELAKAWPGIKRWR